MYTQLKRVFDLVKDFGTSKSPYMVPSRFARHRTAEQPVTALVLIDDEAGWARQVVVDKGILASSPGLYLAGFSAVEHR
jgi:hypothetical protein